MFAGLLVDFQGAASKMLIILPIVEALLPIAALGGTTFFGLWSASAIGNSIIERRKKKFKLSTRKAAMTMTKIQARVRRYDYTNRHDYWKLERNQEALEQTRLWMREVEELGLAPPAGPHAVGWHRHLSKLLPHVRRYGVRRARAERDRWYKGGSKRGGANDR